MKICAECGAEFAPKTYKSICCSLRCRQLERSKRPAVLAKLRAAKRTGYREEWRRDCAQCGKSYVPQKRNGRFCDPGCYAVYYRSEYLPHQWYPKSGKEKKREHTARVKRDNPEAYRRWKRAGWLKQAYGITLE